MTDTEPLGPGSGDEMAVKLSEIEKAAEVATPGPWWPSPMGSVFAGHGSGFDRMIADSEPADATFIAASRTAIPALTAALRDVLAVSREDVAGALHADDLAHERASSEWPDMDPEARDWYLDQADVALALIRAAITAHVDPT